VSPITLAECLVRPIESKRTDLSQAFEDLLTAGPATEFATVDREAAGKAAELRAKYSIPLLDAFQLALAITTHCDAFLTNDLTLKRVPDIDVIVIDEIHVTS
jgi:predicted nucleic acid-binding protein